MRIRCMVSLLAACAFMGGAIAARPAIAEDDLVTETLHLKYTPPSGIIAMVTYSGPDQKSLVPKGIRSLMPDDAERTLRIHGTAESVDALRNVVRLADVEPRFVQVPLRLLRYRYVPGEKTPVVEEIGVLTARIANNSRANLTAFGDKSIFTVEVTPHINGDSSITVKVDLTIKAEQGAGDTLRTLQSTRYRRLQPGKPELVVGVSPEMPELSNFAGTPERLRATKTPITVYYLEAAPQVAPNPNAVSSTTVSSIR